MTIGNTHKCNLECPMCFKQLDPVNNATWPDLDFRCFEAVAHEVFPHVRRIRLTVSGEPLLSNTIDDELELCSTYGVRTTITTNGLLLHRPGLLERLVRSLDLLSVSIDAASKTIYEYVRAGGSFDRVIDNVRLFNEMRNSLPDDVPRPLLHFIFVLQRANVTELPAFIDLAHELDVDLVTVDYVILHAGLNESDSLDQHRRQVNDALERATETAERRGINLKLPSPLHVDDAVPDNSSGFRVPSPRSMAELKGKIHARDWRVPPNPLPTVIDSIRANGGGNREFIAELEAHGFRCRLRWRGGSVRELGPEPCTTDGSARRRDHLS